MNYPLDKRNKVQRVPARGHYDQETVYNILDAGFMCHVSFAVNDQPFVIPTLYGRKDNWIYIHGATTSRLIKNLEKGFEISLAVTHVDGLVLARSAFHHSMNYRSVVVFGKARLVEEDMKNEALKIISDQVLPKRWEEARKPNKKELKATTVLRIEIEQASAKIREGGPSDELADYDLDIWAGVVPIKSIYEEPIADDKLKNEIPKPPSLKHV